MKMLCEYLIGYLSRLKGTVYLNITFDCSQWKKLWQLISGIHYETPNAVVQDRLSDVSKQLTDGILMYKKAAGDKTSEEQLKKVMKERNQHKLLAFATKLYQYLVSMIGKINGSLIV